MYFVIVIVRTEAHITYRGERTIKNKDDQKINRARWTLTSIEQPNEAKQDCKSVKRQSELDPSGVLVNLNENLIRCTRYQVPGKTSNSL